MHEAVTERGEDELQLFLKEIPSLALIMIPRWKRLLYDPLTRVLAPRKWAVFKWKYGKKSSHVSSIVRFPSFTTRARPVCVHLHSLYTITVSLQSALNDPIFRIDLLRYKRQLKAQDNLLGCREIARVRPDALRLFRATFPLLDAERSGAIAWREITVARTFLFIFSLKLTLTLGDYNLKAYLDF